MRNDLMLDAIDVEEDADGLEGTLHSGEEGKCEKGAPVTCQPRLIFPSCFQPASRHARPQLDPDWLSLALPASDWLQRVITALPLYGCYCTASNEE